MEEARRIYLDYFQSGAFDKFRHLFETHYVEYPVGILVQMAPMQQSDPGRTETVMIVEHENAVFGHQPGKSFDRSRSQLRLGVEKESKRGYQVEFTFLESIFYCYIGLDYLGVPKFIPGDCQHGA